MTLITTVLMATLRQPNLEKTNLAMTFVREVQNTVIGSIFRRKVLVSF